MVFPSSGRGDANSEGRLVPFELVSERKRRIKWPQVTLWRLPGVRFEESRKRRVRTFCGRLSRGFARRMTYADTPAAGYPRRAEASGEFTERR
jgi:hypothetical protein